MTMEQYAYLGEIIAAVAVIASLVYVAKQLGQNTAIMRVTASSERLERDYDIVAPLIENRELAEIWMKGGQEFDALDDVDKQRLLFFERRAIMLWNHTYQLRKQHLLPDAIWQENLWIIQNIGRREAVREAWSMFRSAFDPSFQKFVEDQFAIGEGRLEGTAVDLS